MAKKEIKRLIVIIAVVAAAVAIAAVCACAGNAAAKDKNTNAGGQNGAAPTLTLVSSQGNEDTYRMEFPGGGSCEFTVTNGVNGEEGKSAYEIYAAAYGYDGDEQQWLKDLLGGNLAGQKQRYSVVFDSAGGSAVPSQVVDGGKKAVMPEAPVKDNYTFEGWYINGEKWVFSGFPVTENIVLTAAWSENYTLGLSYEDIGGALSVSGMGSAEETRVVVPSEINGAPVTAVQDGAFANNREILSVLLPDSVGQIGKEAFFGCTALEEIRLGGAVDIGERAFYGCGGLKEVTVPRSATTIGKEAFYGCDGLEKIVFEGAARSYGSDAFRLNAAPSVIVESVEDWCASTFDGAYSHPLGSASQITAGGKEGELCVPEGVLNVPAYAFSGTTAITEVSLPTTLCSVGEYAFYGCGLRGELVLPDAVQRAGRSAFGKAASLERIEAGDGLVEIGEYAFAECGALREISLGAGLQKLPVSAFEGDYLLSKIEISPDNLTYFSTANCVVERAAGVLIMGCSGSGSPQDVSSVADNAFASALYLTTADIPEGVTAIGKNAFAGCAGLLKVTLPSTLTEIGENAFEGCRKLVEVVNKSSLPVKKYSPEHGKAAFYAKAVLSDGSESRLVRDETGLWFYRDVQESALVGYDGDETVLVLPERCEGREYYVYPYAFYKNRYLREITVPSGVTAVESQAFYGCSALEKATFYGTCWIGKGAFRDCKSLKEVDLGKTAAVCDEAFMNCRALSALTFSDGIEKIGERAFYGCGGLVSVVLPPSVSDLGADCFGGCNGLEKIVFGGTKELWEKVSVCPGWVDENAPEVEFAGENV